MDQNLDALVAEMIKLYPQPDGSMRGAPPPALNTPMIRPGAPQGGPPMLPPPAAGAAGAGMMNPYLAGIAGMLMPSALGRPQNEQAAMDMISQQRNTIGGGPSLNHFNQPEDLEMMIKEIVGGGAKNPAPRLELYESMESEGEGGMIAPGDYESEEDVPYEAPKKSPKKGKSAKSDAKPKGSQKAAPPVAPVGGMGGSMGMSPASGNNPFDDIVNEIMMDELTRQPSPLRRGSFPKRVKQPPAR